MGMYYNIRNICNTNDLTLIPERWQIMDETQLTNMNQMLNALPGGLLRIAMDDELSIVHGTEKFYKLINMDYSKSAKYPESIFKTVYSADIIYYTQQIAAQKQRKDNQLLLFYRVLQKNGSIRWIMISGTKTEEEYQKNNKTLPIYFCMALDASDYMIKNRNIEQELSYHRTILELSRELFFEYIIAADTLSFSQLFREIFGKESEIKGFGNKLEKTKLVHPVDLPRVVKVYKGMMSGKKQANIELRMISKDGEIAWYVCYASIIYDENKNPYKVVGKLAVIKTRLEEVKKPSFKIQQDSLTKVYTGETAENMIKEEMHLQEPEALSVFFICEIYNYKEANEVDGNTEENVLTAIAGILKSLFRCTDIIGRLGLGYFTIYMRGINSKKSAYEKAEAICREVNRLYSYDYKSNRVFISVGVAMVKGSSDYTFILEKAKEALQRAKKDNKSSFEVFYQSLRDKK